MRMTLYGFCALIFFACNSNQPTDERAGPNEAHRFFPGFPDQQYKTLTLGDSAQVLINRLKQEAYTELKNQPGHWKNESSQTEVILPDVQIISEFKVFFYSSKDIRNSENFKQFFQDHAIESNFGKEFSTYEIMTQNYGFSITFFEQPDFLRLNFELKSKH